jgi:chitodextrinase
MASSIYVGLAVTAQNNTQLNTSTFDNVTVTDTEVPTAPTNLASIGHISTSVSLSWVASNDNVGVTGYDVYTGGSFAGSTTNTSYTVSGLSASTAYTFTVKARDAVGNVSAASNAVNVTTDAAASFWLSGGSRNTNKYSATQDWGNFRHRSNTFQTVYTNRGSGWSDFISSFGSSGQISNFHDPNLTMLIQTSPFPENVNVGANYSALINGDYDSYWQQIGTKLKNRADAGLPVIVSIAWEMNGTFNYWGCGTGPGKYSSPSQYIAGYQKVVDDLRVTYPGVQTAWIINAHGTPSACVSNGDAWALYPGDDYVTYVGTDNYDMYPPSLTKTDFDNTANANGGLYWLADHARQEGKKIIVGEWGVVSGSGSNGGGDNPGFVDWMFQTFQSWYNEGILESEYYFDDPMGGGNVDSDLIDNGNPNSSAEYVRLYQE